MARPQLEPGTVIDGFTVGELICKGGMSHLFKATHPDIGFSIVMKIPILSEGEDPAAIVGFEMEQMILPRLAGPHVPRFVAEGDFAVQPYVVMEYVPGPSLLNRRPELPLPYDEVAALGAKIATALDHLHRQHVIHLDIKPSNVLFRASGEAVLIDYGLAHHTQLPDLMEEEFRLPYGTAPYMAPEQVLGTRNDPRSDLFALGVLMYFFSTGVRPFGDPQRLRVLKHRIWRDPMPPRQLRPDYPPWLQEIVLRCLEVNPSWRYPSAAQLAFDLRHPEQINLTARSEKRRQDSHLKAFRRRFNGDIVRPLRKQAMASHIAGAPIVAVALDFGEESERLTETLRAVVLRVLETTPDARLACLHVLKQHRVKPDSTLDADGHSKHIHRLVQLKHWSEPLKLSDGKITHHVLEAVEPAAAILDYAHSNHVDHIIMGARTNSTMRKLLGSVSGEVAAQAPCTVTVVRKRDYQADSE